jgi:hypothetical protein
MNPDFSPFPASADRPQPAPDGGNARTHDDRPLSQEPFGGRIYTIDPWTGEKVEVGNKS